MKRYLVVLLLGLSATNGLIAQENSSASSSEMTRPSREDHSGPQVAPENDPRVKAQRAEGQLIFVDQVTYTIKIQDQAGKTLQLTGDSNTPVRDSQGALRFSDLRVGDEGVIFYTDNPLQIKNIELF